MRSLMFLVLVLFCSVTLTSSAFYHGNCCMVFSIRRIPVRQVKSYYRTSSDCPIPAIVFKTFKGREYCVDPQSNWVNYHVYILDKRTAAATTTPTTPITTTPTTPITTTTSAPLTLNLANCCMKFFNVKIQVISYYWTSSSCPIPATVFQTFKEICINPESWVNDMLISELQLNLIKYKYLSD